MANHPNRSVTKVSGDTLVFIVTARNLITEGATATAETISVRLGWGAERLAAWLRNNQMIVDTAEQMAALEVLCANGIRTKFAA